MRRTILNAAWILLLIAALPALAQDEASAPKGWSRLAKGWIPAIQAEGTYDPAYPDSIPPRLVETLLAVQNHGITPDYLKRIDKTGDLMNKVVYWSVQGQDPAKIEQKVLATPEAVKHPPHGAKKTHKH